MVEASDDEVIAALDLEVVLFHHRPERYKFSVTLPRTVAAPGVGLTESDS